MNDDEGSLPDRQLRNVEVHRQINLASSLPDRQLRKSEKGGKLIIQGSLPDRQLRNLTPWLK